MPSSSPDSPGQHTTVPSHPAIQRFKGILRAYRAIALVVFNTLILLVLLNAAAWAALHLHRGSGSELIVSSYGQSIYGAYPGRTKPEVDRLLSESWNRYLAYDPFTAFTERPASGTYVNVSDAGVRRGSGPNPWPPVAANFNIFFFGGSTTFCYGVADDET